MKLIFKPLELFLDLQFQAPQSLITKMKIISDLQLQSPGFLFLILVFNSLLDLIIKILFLCIIFFIWLLCSWLMA